MARRADDGELDGEFPVDAADPRLIPAAAPDDPELAILPTPTPQLVLLETEV